MMKRAIIVSLGVSLVGLFLFVLAGNAKEPGNVLVSVVGLDEQGNPLRQGMGVVVSKEGEVLTSASIVSNCRSAVVKTADGTLHLVRGASHRDGFQDSVLLQLAPGASKLAPVVAAPGFQLPEKVWVGIRQSAGGQLKEARLTKALPFSPRLVLLKLEPANLQSEAGSPILNRRGELVGMLHVFGGTSDQSSSCQLFLALDRSHLAPQKDEQKAAANSPEGALSNPPSAGEQAFWEAVGASMRQDWKEAQNKFTVSLNRPERLPEAYYGRGVARYQLGDSNGAVTDLEEAARRMPGYALAFLWLGKVEKRQGRSEAARRDYRQAATLSPDLSEAWFLLGEMEYQGGDLARAREHLERAAEDADLGARCRYYLGSIALREKHPEAALAEFKQAIALEPGFFRARLDGGRLLLEELDKPEEAAAWLREAVRLNPHHAMSRYYLALAYVLSWNRAGAWEQYFALQNENPELAAQLAVTFERFH